MTRLNTAVSTFAILVFMLGAKAEAAEIDYAENVAPIFVEQCQSCHREGGIAPWAMTDYRMLQAFAPAIKEAVTSLRMPPGQIDRKYAGTIINHRTLSNREIETIVEWIDAGALVEGDVVESLI